MGYENDPFVDEDGEPLMDPDAQFDREPSPEPLDPLDDGDVEEDWRRERSPTPVHESAADKGRKPRKRLVKKIEGESTPVFPEFNLISITTLDFIHSVDLQHNQPVS